MAAGPTRGRPVLDRWTSVLFGPGFPALHLLVDKHRAYDLGFDARFSNRLQNHRKRSESGPGAGYVSAVKGSRTEDTRMGRARMHLPRLKLVVYLTITCFILLLVQNRSAFGQVDEGAITGTVQDSTGAVVPDAQVTLVNTDVGLTLETKSSSSGGYTFSPVRIGNYTITVTAKGFSKTTQ